MTRLYFINAKREGEDWKVWAEVDSYEKGRDSVVALREQHPTTKFRLIERTLTDVITEA